MLLTAVAVALVAIGCGEDAERQDANEPGGEFPVEVTSAKFRTEQRLAQTSDLTLEIENIGDEAVPDLAVTIYTGDEQASGAFSVRSEQPGLADAHQPVWILEEDYPKCIAADKAPQCLTPGEVPKNLDDAPAAGAEAAQTNTFSFGALEPGDSIEAIWRVTPVDPGTYTVHYELAAGLDGNAKAVTDDGSRVTGEFVVTITDKPPRARVNDAGEVEITNP